jgi:hypothetical protein
LPRELTLTEINRAAMGAAKPVGAGAV